MEPVEKYQQQLLERTKYIHYQNPITPATQQAYLATPRHLFVKHYREWATREWREVNEDNIAQHLEMLYADRPLILFGEDDEQVPSTISQPSFVLRMLDMLQLEPGQTVFELGAGSGWNAALMGQLVGSEGQVYSLEIIPEVAQTAAATIAELGVENVKIIAADGGGGYSAGAPYERAIFTAGTYDLPHHFFEQMSQGSLSLIVIKNAGGGDTLFVFRKNRDHFEAIESMPCGFVQMTGHYQLTDLEPLILAELPEWSELKSQEVNRRSFWWGGKGQEGLRWRTRGIRSFLSIVEPSFQTFKTDRGDDRSRAEHYFGLWDKANRSLVIAKDDLLISYGNSSAEERLMQDLTLWVALGMPSAASFALKIYPIEYPLTAHDNQWIVKRSEAQFLWSLNN